MTLLRPVVPKGPDRRLVLQLGAVSLLLSGAGCGVADELALVPRTDAASSSMPTIDVHCHIFNARDLPIRNFVRMIVFEGRPIGVALDPLIAFLSFIMDQQSPTAADELAVIATLSSQPGLSGPHAVGSASLAGNSARKREIVVRALERLRRGETASETITGAAAVLPSAANIQFYKDLSARYRPLAPTPPPGSAGPLSDLERIFDGIERADDAITNYVEWAYRYTLYRYEILNSLGRWPASDASEIRLFCPAVIDYAYWLQQFDTTPLAQQALVMEAISRMPQGGGAVHGYIAFDPWRQIAEPETLDLLKDAVRNRGFVGVKLYPPMGFRPIGNANLQSDQFPAALRRLAPQPGVSLDQALRELYDWCIQDDVPIEAHCSYSQFPNPGYGARAAPEGWEAALEVYPRLRLNLGHCGGPWDMGVNDPSRPDASEWTPRVIRLLGSGKYPNLYADVSDAAIVLDRDASEAAQDKKVTDRLRALLAQYPRAKRRLMYGSDWSLLGREYRSELYYPHMKEGFGAAIGLSPGERVGFLSGNAARFLGLAPADNGAGATLQTRQRLEAFYRRNGLDPNLLRPFTEQPQIS